MTTRTQFAITFSAAVFLVCALGGSAFSQIGKSKYRKLAPGVMIQVVPEIDNAETFTGPRELVEIVHGYPELNWQPNYSAKSETLYCQGRKRDFAQGRVGIGV